MLTLSLGLVSGYCNDKDGLETSMRSLEDKNEYLVTELQRTDSQLEELRSARAELHAREEQLDRQRQALEQSVGEKSQGNLKNIIGFPVDTRCWPNSDSMMGQC